MSSPSSPTSPSSGRAPRSRSLTSASAAWSARVTMSVSLDLVAATSTPSARSRTTRSPASRAVARARSQSSSDVGAHATPPRAGCSPARVGAAADRRRGPSTPGRRRRPPGRRPRPARPRLARRGARGPSRRSGRRSPTSARPDRVETEPLGGRQGLGVEVVDDLHVVGHEPDRHQHDRAHPVAGELLQVVVDVGLEPRDLGRTRPRAEHEVRRMLLTGHRPRPAPRRTPRVAVLGEVGAAVRSAAVVHRLGDGVGDEHRWAPGRSATSASAATCVDHRVEEAGVVVVGAQPVETRRPVTDVPPRRRRGPRGTAGTRSTTSRRW